MKPVFNNCTNHTKHSGSIVSLTNAALLFLTIIALTFAACNGCGEKKTGEQPAERKEGRHPFNRHHLGDGQDYEFVTKDSANKMLSSYLASINSQQEDSELHCVIVDADSLRAYLANTNIHKVKIMFAHTLDYINAGNQGQPCGYLDGALTFIIVGFDTAGNYVFYPAPPSQLQEVIDHGMPCPDNCPKSGTASNDLLR